MGLYAIVLAGGGYCGPLMYGFIADRLGFEWTFSIATIIASVGLIIIFFMMEETNYVRRPGPVIEAVDVADAQEKPAKTAKDDSNETEGISSTPSDAAGPSNTSQAYAGKKPYIKRLALWHPTPGVSVWASTVRTFKYLTWPIIFYAG